MAVAKVQGTTGNGATIVLNGCVAANALIYQCSFFRGSVTGVNEAAPADSNGTFVVASAAVLNFQGSNDTGASIFYEQNINAGTHTVTPETNPDHQMALTEFSGLATSGMFVANSKSTASTHDATGTIVSQATGSTVTAAAAGYLACISFDRASSPGNAAIGITDPVSGYTTLKIGNDDSTTVAHMHAFQVLAAGGTQAATFNWTEHVGEDEHAVAVIATFVAAASAAFAPMMPVVIWGRSKIRLSRLPTAQPAAAVAVAYVWLPTGGFTFAGTAPYNKGKVYAVSGGLTFAGTAPYNKGKVYAVSGGLVFGGVATTLYTPAGAVDYVYTPSGGMVFGGTAPYNKGKVFAVSGGLVLGGAAVLLKGKVYAPSGGLVFGGNAVVLKGKVYVVSGGLTFGGIAPYEFSGTVVVAAIRTINSPLNVGTLLNRS